MLFDHLLSKYEDGVSIWDISKDEAVIEKLPKLYVPGVETTPTAKFISNGGTVFMDQDGPKKIRFLVFNRFGVVLTSPGSSFTQIPPKGRLFLARYSCPAMSTNEINLKLDYFVEMSKVTLMPIGQMFTQKKNDGSSDIIEDHRYEFTSYDTEGANKDGVMLHPFIERFDESRNEIIQSYFK